MKKALKKLAAVVATAAMAICAMVATPSEAKADTTKEIYLVVDADATYSMGFWSPSGATLNAEQASDGWTYVFTKVQDGLYKIEVTLTADWTATGMSLSVDGTEKYKADPEWSGDAGAAGWTAFTEALNGADTAVYIKLAENDTQATIEMTTAPAEGGSDETPSEEPSSEETPSEEPSSDDETTTAPATDDGGDKGNDDGSILPYIIVAVVVVVVIVVAVVMSKKKKN